MGTDKTIEPADLRRQAEARLQLETTKKQTPRTDEEILRLLHELEVYEIELEMQNAELRQNQAKLEKILASYTDLYEFAPVGYVNLERNGVISAVNLRGATLLGVERGSLIGQHFDNFVQKADVPALSSYLSTIFTSKRKETCELTLLNQGTSPRIVQIEQIEALIDASQPECRLAMIDISLHRRAEDALRDSEERMYGLSEMAVDAIIMMDECNAVTFCNSAAERIFGFSIAEITGQNFYQLCIPKRHLLWTKQDFAQFRQKGTGPLIGRNTEITARRKDGTEFPLEISLSSQKFQGKWHAIGIMRDITARKLAEKRTSEVSRQQQAILDNIPNAAWLKDREGRYVAVNEPYRKAFGEDSKDLVGKKDFDIFSPELAEKYEKEVKEVMRSGKRTTFNETRVDSEGKTQYLEKVKTPIFNDFGEVFGVIGIIYDVTGTKEIEESLRHESTHDILTGLYNRAFFDAELERLSHGRMFPLSIVMADINDLKKVNDTLGHSEGDKMISLAARVMLAAFRSEDIVARIGGDEFAVLLPETDCKVAEKTVERVLRCSEVVNGEVRIAFGIACAENEDNIAEALKHSDERMYQDKVNQKNEGKRFR